MINIRQYKATDCAVVRDICLVTAYGGNKVLSEKMQKLTLLSYCDYYIENEQNVVFVAVDESDTPVGYILGSADYAEFYKKMKEIYLPKMRKISHFYACYFGLALWYNKRFGKKYPAHMHIDITEGCQRQGAGKKLTDALLAKLAELNVTKLFLQTGADNKKGRGFYKKYGFSQLSDFFGCVTYVIDVK